MEIQKFGARLRELRKQAGMTQRELADKVNVSFTYISKIENGVVVHPSKGVILKLAEVLNADKKDELLILAGRVPSDISEKLLENPQMLHLMRSKRAQKIFKAFSKARTSLQNLTRGLHNSTEGTALFFKNHKGFSRVAISVAMVVAIVAGLWSASPAQALNITITNPSSGTLGSTYSFTVQVDVENTDLLPIDHINLDIYYVNNPSTYKVGCTNLPLAVGSKTYTPTGGGTVNVSATTASGWGGASGTLRYGYGYGYQSGWGTYNFDTNYGYGYGYGSYIGLTSITYNITWMSPSGWPQGAYEILVLVYGNGSPTAFTTPTVPSFTLYAPVVVEEVVEPGVTSIPVYWDGRVTSDVVAESVDGKAGLDIPKDTIAKTAEGQPLREISIIPMEDPPAPPVDASIVGLTYDLGPDGATFDPPITLTFTYDPDEIPEDFNEEDLVIAIWDGEKWVELEGCVVNTATHTITAPVSHFTPFTIITPAPPAPAAFSVSSLSVLPAEVEPGETVTIAVSIANTGGESGSYTVVLKIDGVKESEKRVTVAAGGSKTVSFSVTKEEADSYTVTVDGLSVSFTVAPVVVPPEPAAFSVSYLSVSPRLEVEPGETVAITVLVANTGGKSGSYTVVLKIDGVKEAEETVIVAAGESQDVSFSVTREEADSYAVTVDGLSGSFTVVAPVVEEEEVITPVVEEEEGLAWWIWLIVGLGSAVVVGLLVYFLWWKWWRLRKLRGYSRTD